MKRHTSTPGTQGVSVASAALLAAVLATTGPTYAYAEETASPTNETGSADNVVAEKEVTTPKTRDEAQNQLNADIKDLDAKSKEKDEAAKSVEAAQADFDAKTTESKTALDEAKSAFEVVKAEGAKQVDLAAQKVEDAKASKAEKEADLSAKTDAIAPLEEVKEVAEAKFNEEKSKAEEQGLSLEKLEAAKSELDAAKALLDQKTTAVQNAQTTRQAAADALEQANNAQVAAETAKHKAEEDKAAAEASLQEANAKLTEATEALEALQTSETEQTLQDAQELKTQAEQALAAAQSDLEAKNAILATKTADLETAEQAKAAAVQAKADADASLEQAKSDLQTAKNTVVAKQTAYDAFTDPITQATGAKATAETEKTQAQEDVAEKQKAVETAQGEVDAARTALEEAQKLAEGAADNSAKLLEGAFAYFEHVVEQGGEDAEDAAQALKILKESPLHEAVQKGNPLSATAVENMLKALEFIDRSNELRAGEIEDPDLKVSHTLMALAMVKADWAATHTDSSNENFGAYYNGENVSKGGEDPFSWFDNEKNIVNVATLTEGLDLDNPAIYEGWAESVAQGQEGHEHPLTNRDRVHRYVTLTNLDVHNTGSKLESLYFDGTGFGVSKLNPENQPTYVQDFATDPLVKGQGSSDAAIAGEQPKPLHLMTSEEYRTALNAWKDSLQAGSSSDVEAKRAALTAANERLEAAKTNHRAAQQILEQKEAALADKTSKLEELERQQANALEELNAAKQTETETQANHDTLEGSIGGLETAVVDKTREAQEAQDAKDTAQRDVEDAEGVKTTAEGDLETKTRAFNEAKTAHDQYLEQKKQAEVAKVKAETDVLAKTDAVSQAEEAVRQAQADLDNAIAEVGTKTNDKDAADTALIAAEGEKTTAAADVETKQTVYDTMKRDLTALIESKSNLDKAVKNLSDAKAAKTEAQNAVDKAQSDLDAAEAENTAAETRKNTLDAVVFAGSKTPVVGDTKLDALVDALKLAEASLAASQTALDNAKAALAAAERVHKDAIAKVALDRVILDSFTLKVLDGDGQKEFAGNPVVFRINHEPAGFSVVKVDGSVIDKSHYEVAAGSTVVTIKGSYTKGMAEGPHTFEAIYENGAFANAGFTILIKPAEKPVLPPTVDVATSTTEDKTPTVVLDKATQTTEDKATQTHHVSEVVKPGKEAVSPKTAKHAATPQTSDMSFMASATASLMGMFSLGVAKRTRKDAKHFRK